MDTARFDADLIRRHDRPGPRYTSYPTAPQFSLDFSEAAFRAKAQATNGEPIPAPLSLYLHVPYCMSPCFYCGCNRVITRDTAKGHVYTSRLLREIELVAPLFDRDREVAQVHFGGGTPNFLPPALIGELMGSLSRQFSFSAHGERDFSIELDPRHIGPDGIGSLAQTGFNRASLGVQDFDPVVQKAVNRVQSIEQTVAVIEACRESRFRSVNVDLIYGLPAQTELGFARTLDTVIAAGPNRVAVYSYAHLPEVFRPQRQLDASLLPTGETKLRLLEIAIEKLSAAGYVYIGMDHFALPDDDLARALADGTLQRNFMGYTTHSYTDLIGFGVSAISHVGDSFSQNHRDLPSWEQAIDRGQLATWRGIELDFDDVVRADLIQRLMCAGELDTVAFGRQYAINFENYFDEALERMTTLTRDGLVDYGRGRITITARGRLLVRVVAMCFDAYVSADTSTRFSRTV